MVLKKNRQKYGNVKTSEELGAWDQTDYIFSLNLFIDFTRYSAVGGFPGNLKPP
jgi:hypothetical protein